MPRVRSTAIAFAAAATFSLAAPAQCAFDWLPGSPADGPLGTVTAMLVQPNGELIAGGSFAVADAAVAPGLARWTGTSWQALGVGWADASVLARLPSGDLLATGHATPVGSSPASVGRWDGATWQGLGLTFDREIRALQAMPNGDVIAGGFFRDVGGTPIRSIARWDGTAWTAIPGAPLWFEVHALVLLPNGDLIVGGEGAGVAPAAAHWDGTTWTPLPGLSANSVVTHLALRSNGTLLLAGTLHGVTGTTAAAALAVFDGVAMQALSAPATPVALLAAANGDIVIGDDSSAAPGVFRWNGSAWSTLASGPRPRVLVEDGSGALIAAGHRGPVLGAVTRLAPTGWITLGAPRPPVVNAAVRMPDGDVVVGGEFASFAGVAANNVVRWNGATWQPLGAGVDGRVTSLGSSPDGHLVVGGEFAHAGGAPAQRIARWNGHAWTTVGAGLAAPPLRVAMVSGGRVLASTQAAGGTAVWEYVGLAWNLLGVTGTVADLVGLPNDRFALVGFLGAPGLTGSVPVLFHAGGSFTTPPPSPVAGIPVAVDALRDGNGDLLVGLVGALNSGLWRWDGTVWSLASGSVFPCNTALPDGTFAGNAGGGVSRPKPGGLQRLGPMDLLPSVVVASGSGDLFAAGGFGLADGAVSVGFAHGRPNCPASVTSVGAGCTGSAGPVTLSTAQAPWTGGTFAMVATGMTANSAAVLVVGVQPLAVPLPGGAPGCSVFVDPMSYAVFTPVGGAVTVRWDVPDSVILAGLAVRAQVGGVEFGTTGIDRLTSTNALQALIGSL